MNLRNFLEKMEEEKQVLHVKSDVSKDFEASQVTKSFDDQGPILLFERVRNSKTRIVTNVCGTRGRVCTAIGTKSDGLYGKLLEAWRLPRKTKIVKDAPVREVCEKNVDLRKIPVLKHYERDAGPYITSGVIYARSVDGTAENVSVHRLQVLDRDHLTIRLVPRHLLRLWNLAKAAGKDLDVSISVGVHPSVMLAAASPVSFGVNEFEVASGLMNGQFGVVHCENVDAFAVADAELVLDGRVSATKEVMEGPFVDVTGTYDVRRKQPVVEVVGIMHRSDYIYQGLLPAGSEHRILMGLPHEVLIWDAVSKVVPKVFAVNLSDGGSGWLHAVISIEKQVDGDGKNALVAAFAAHPSLKQAVVVDSDINVFDPVDVEWAIATRFQASEDLLKIGNIRGSTLDSSADQQTGLTSKIGMDATVPFTKSREKFTRAKIPVSKHSESVIRSLHEL
jgi:2,5-furandicarboxylate decarboxylase 1